MLPMTGSKHLQQTKLRVVVYEDNKMEQIGIRTELDAQPDMEIVGITADLAELLHLIDDSEPHVAILDLKIYDNKKGGFEALKGIKQRYTNTKCLIFTNYEELANQILAIDAGAEGFARKAPRPGQQPDLPELVRMLASGGRYYVSDLILEMRKYLDFTQMESNKKQDTKDNNPLTAQEQKVLSFVGNRLPDAEIGRQLTISENTVTAHFKNIFDKLGVRDRFVAYQMALVAGWLENSIPENNSRK